MSHCTHVKQLTPGEHRVLTTARRLAADGNLTRTALAGALGLSDQSVAYWWGWLGEHGFELARGAADDR